MIGAFARMVGRRDRVVQIEDHETEGFALRTKRGAAYEAHDTATDAPPEAFVHSVADEGGVVIFAPVLDALRSTLRRARGLPEDPSISVPQAPSPEASTEGSA